MLGTRTHLPVSGPLVLSTIVTGLDQFPPWFVSAAPLDTILRCSCELEELTEAASSFKLVFKFQVSPFYKGHKIIQPVFHSFDTEPAI